MPLMRDWMEIHLADDLLIAVVTELLSLAEDPNHVEVTNGPEGRVILVQKQLAEVWLSKVQGRGTSEDIVEATDVVAPVTTPPAPVAPAPVAAVPAPAAATPPPKPATAANEDGARPEVAAVAPVMHQAPAPVVTPLPAPAPVAVSTPPQAAAPTAPEAPEPVKRGPGRPRKNPASASNGEES